MRPGALLDNCFNALWQKIKMRNTVSGFISASKQPGSPNVTVRYNSHQKKKQKEERERKIPQYNQAQPTSLRMFHLNLP